MLPLETEPVSLDNNITLAPNCALLTFVVPFSTENCGDNKVILMFFCEKLVKFFHFQRI